MKTIKAWGILIQGAQVSFGLILLLLSAMTSWGASVELVPAGAVWKFNDTGSDLGTAWREPGFDDAGWASGPAELGYGDGGEATWLDNSPIRPCYYFRHTFSVANPAQFTSLSLEVLRDDGCVVYLNGQEVARYNMPAGTISYSTWASVAADYSWDPPQTIANLLVSGENVIAVEVHQSNSTSTDVSLDLRLTGTIEITVALESPAAGEVGVAIPATLTATTTDPEGQPLNVSFWGRPALPPVPDFTIVVLPDTQYYTDEVNGGTKEIFINQTDWIVNNREAHNIVYVAQLGDLSNSGDNYLDQWVNASTAMYRLENPILPLLPEGIPYGAAVGNHDQYVPSGDTEPTTYYNQYFGASHFAGRSYYGGNYGNNNNNHFQLFSASGLDFIVIYFEYDTTPDAAVLTWADSLLKANPGRRAILVTHYFLNPEGTFGAQGAAIYEALKDNPNLFLMLCGHNDVEAQRTDVYNNNTVHTLMSDYQSYANGGNGFLRIMRFSPSNNQIHVQTYSPWLNQYETDASSQFTLSYPMQSGPAFEPIQQNAEVVSGTLTSATWTGLAPETEYEWYVTASDGIETKASVVGRFTTWVDNTPPTAPSGLAATAQSSTSILLTWADASGNESGFAIYQSLDGVNFSPIGTTGPNATRATITGLQANTAYSYIVSAFNGAGSADSVAASTTTPLPPPLPTEPSGLTATAASNTEILLAWADNSVGETGFQIERSPDGINWTVTGAAPADTTNIRDVGLTSGSIYYYRVSACNESGCSAPSAMTAAAPFADSSANGELLVSATLVGTYTSTYGNDSVYEQLTEKLSGGKPNTRYSSLEHKWTFNVTPGKSLRFYIQAHKTSTSDGENFAFAYSTDDLNYQEMLVVTATTDGDVYQTYDLPPTLQGTVYVRVQDTDHTIGKTALDTLYVDHLVIRSDANPVMSPPARPVLTEVTAGDQTVTLTWAVSSGATRYTVSRDSVVVADGLTATTYTDTQVVNGTIYQYSVTAHNVFGSSEPSIVSATPQAPVATQPISNLTAAGGKRKITLTWPQSVTPGITQNIIYRSTTSGGPYALLTTIPAATSYSDAVATGSTFYYVVTAVSSSGESDDSNVASATAK